MAASSSGASGGYMDQRALAEELFAAAMERARAGGFELGRGADGDLRNYASRAASDIVERDLADGKDLALRNFHTLIDEMIRQARQIPGYAERNAGVIGEETLGSALAVLCPLWPFC